MCYGTCASQALRLASTCSSSSRRTILYLLIRYIRVNREIVDVIFVCIKRLRCFFDHLKCDICLTRNRSHISPPMFLSFVPLYTLAQIDTKDLPHSLGPVYSQLLVLREEGRLTKHSTHHTNRRRKRRYSRRASESEENTANNTGLEYRSTILVSMGGPRKVQHVPFVDMGMFSSFLCQIIHAFVL